MTETDSPVKEAYGVTETRLKEGEVREGGKLLAKEFITVRAGHNSKVYDWKTLSWLPLSGT